MYHTQGLSEQAIQQLAADWYHKLDVHAPMVELLPMLADEGLEMQFPEGTLHGHAGFEGWYQGVIRLFFDEEHTVKSVDVHAADGEAEVKVVVQWQANRWNPPAAQSDRINVDAYQTWTVKPSPDGGRPLITRYVVDEIKYHDGSARL